MTRKKAIFYWLKLHTFAALFALMLSGNVLAQTIKRPARFNLQGIQVSEVIQIIYSEVVKTPYVLEPEVFNDSRLVSFRYNNSKGDIQPFLNDFLDTLGYVITKKGAVDIISKKTEIQKAKLNGESFIYRPKYRDVNYLARLLSPLFQGGFSVNRSVSVSNPNKQGNNPPEGSAAAMLDQGSDVMLFTGTQREIAKLKTLLPQVDFPVGEVIVRGVVYEVSTTTKEGSGFGLLLSLLGGKLSVGLGIPKAANNFIRFKNTALDVVFSALSQDGRFKVMSSPVLRIQSGSHGSFSVGQEVPVLGAITYPATGQAVQSVEYRQSGVIFNISPTVRENVVDLLIDQQISNFARTTTGVNNSPTMTKRALRTNVGVQDGDLIILGGLTENKQTKTRDGLRFLPKFLHTRGKETSKSEIILILEVQRI